MSQTCFVFVVTLAAFNTRHDAELATVLKYYNEDHTCFELIYFFKQYSIKFNFKKLGFYPFIHILIVHWCCITQMRWQYRIKRSPFLEFGGT